MADRSPTFRFGLHLDIPVGEFNGKLNVLQHCSLMSSAAADAYDAWHPRVVGRLNNPGVAPSGHWVCRYLLKIPSCHKVID
jgi:hypothetical protein